MSARPSPAKETEARPTPGDTIRAIRKKLGLTLNEVGRRTGMAVSTLSKLEKGRVSLSFDKLLAISKALGVDMAELLEPAPHLEGSSTGLRGRRVVQRAGEGQLVETRSYRQTYLATELLHKRMTPIVVELRARSMEEFREEFGGLIRHPGEEFVHVLDGELEFHSELYAPLRLAAGDSMYFDSEMGHAYLNASDPPCRVVVSCAPRGRDESVIDAFMGASERHAANQDAAEPPPRPKRGKPRNR
ncbi:MAG TPA: XRE family transcriptional regulator [Usitatibacter sp.]|jgi:transcriptional regulator with XRE-family HTH domain|nr:XRE family transcriptional regulator [Usitatibacter sp.]